MECNRVNPYEGNVLGWNGKESHVLGNAEKVSEKEERSVQRFLWTSTDYWNPIWLRCMTYPAALCPASSISSYTSHPLDISSQLLRTINDIDSILNHSFLIIHLNWFIWDRKPEFLWKGCVLFLWPLYRSDYSVTLRLTNQLDRWLIFDKQYYISVDNIGENHCGMNLI